MHYILKANVPLHNCSQFNFSEIFPFLLSFIISVDRIDSDVLFIVGLMTLSIAQIIESNDTMILE
jgi:hypothetical protein